jgi:hypothetical protein
MRTAITRDAGQEILLLAMSAWLLAVVGCSGGSSDKWTQARPPVFKASAKVMYKGKPLEKALVLYHPASGEHSPYGETDADGNVVLTTFDEHDGGPAGSYKVVVTKTEYELKPTAFDSPEEKAVARIPKRLLPEKYSKKETTDLTAEIKADGENQTVFEIKE